VTRDYPHVVTVDKFRDFIRKLQSAGVPERLDDKYLKSLGFTSQHDSEFRRPLRFIGLIDDAATVMPEYSALRGGIKGRQQLEQYIREAYSALYKVHPNANEKDVETLRDFFRAHTKAGDHIVAKMVATFQAMCEFASFDESAPLEEGQPPVEVQPKHGQVAPRSPRPITINVNIQLSLPPTTDSEVYEKLFSSMAKHIKQLEED